jgi:hypothetical protein
MLVLLETLTLCPHYLFDITQNSGRISGDNAVCWDILGNYTTGSHNRIFANCDATEDGRTGTDGYALLDYSPLDFPVGLGLQIPVGAGCPRIAIVDKHHAMADEDVVLNRYALAYKGVARDLAALAHRGVLLDFDKGADLRFVAYFTSIKVDELGQLDVSSKFYVRSDAQIRIHISIEMRFPGTCLSIEKSINYARATALDRHARSYSYSQVARPSGVLLLAGGCESDSLSWNSRCVVTSAAFRSSLATK